MVIKEESTMGIVYTYKQEIEKEFELRAEGKRGKFFNLSMNQLQELSAKIMEKIIESEVRYNAN